MALALAECVNGVPDEHMIVDVGTGRENKLSRGYFPTMTATRCQSRDFFSVPLRRRFTLSELARAQKTNAAALNMECVSARAMGKIIGNAMSIGTMKAVVHSMLQSIGLV